VHIRDLHATMLHLFGIDHDAASPTRSVASIASHRRAAGARDQRSPRVIAMHRHLALILALALPASAETTFYMARVAPISTSTASLATARKNRRASCASIHPLRSSRAPKAGMSSPPAMSPK
jgi:hypothetical protein